MTGVKGNGMTIGFTNNRGLVSGNTNFALANLTSAYGSLSGTSSTTFNTANAQSSTTLGITTDPTKSGIESEINSNINYIMKY